MLYTEQAKGYSKNTNFFQGRERWCTSEVVEFDVGLGSVGVEFGFVGFEVNGLRKKVHGEFEVVFDEGLFGFCFEIGSHERGRERGRERKKGVGIEWRRRF